MTASATYNPQSHMNTHKITEDCYIEGVIEEFLDAPTPRQEIYEIGGAVCDIIIYLQDKVGIDSGDGYQDFLDNRMAELDHALKNKDVPEDIQKSVGAMRLFWKAVAKVIDLNCMQLIMPDEMVEDEICGPEIMGVLPEGENDCYHDALIQILRVLHAWMLEYLNTGKIGVLCPLK